MAKLEAVLFDLDSTLLNTICLKELRENSSFSEITHEKISGTKCYKPVVNVLKRLRELNVKTGIVTNSPKKYAAALLAFHGIGDLIDTVVAYDDVGPTGKKPSPNGISLALAQLGISKLKRVAYVGDEYTDVIAAYRAGVIPIVPSWASREGVSTPPAAELSSGGLLSMAQDIEGSYLFAERCSIHKSTDFQRDCARFLPLDDAGNVVTIRQKMKVFCLGRYFSQKHPVTAKLHDLHPLSLEIAKKSNANYSPPTWMAEMLFRIAKASGYFLFPDESIDIVIVIPHKPGKPKRLELILDKMRGIALSVGSSIEFRDDILFFDTGAAKSLKAYGAQERRIEQNNHLHANQINLTDKRVLVIDDVITTGATIGRAMQLVSSLGAKSVNGIGIAKTVSIIGDVKQCPKCSRDMIIQKNTGIGTRFWGCSGYFEDKVCTHSEEIDPQACPICGKNLRLQRRKRDGSLFYGCTGYFDKPSCSFTKSA